MSLRVALTHTTTYRYSRPVALSPHVIRLRPAPHARTPILSYAIKVRPEQQFLNWQQDPYSNWLARVVFPEPASELRVEVGLVVDMVAINPFDFFVEPQATRYPFTYEGKELAPYLEAAPAGPLLAAWVEAHRQRDVVTIDYLVELNCALKQDIDYVIRMEPGVQTPEETLTRRRGSCRDTGWLLVQILRHLGFAARFVSGYLIQLVADVPALDGPTGPTADFTDLHAWAEVYVPGAGWIGLDPTSGLLAGEGHIPLACSAEPSSAAPVDGTFGFDESEGAVESAFDVSMQVARIHETPRVSKPFSEAQWAAIDALGRRIDERLAAQDVRLTMGGEPTFVSIDDLDGPEWNTAASGPQKRRLAEELVRQLRRRWAPGGALHYGQGKWYPGESLPRWALNCFWRADGEPVWENGELFAAPGMDYGHDSGLAERFVRAVAERLSVRDEHTQPGYEDTWYWLWKERRLPTNIDPFKSNLSDAEERARLARIFEQGLEHQVGWVLPLAHHGGAWCTGHWFFRSERMYLIPGDSPMGYRLPLDSLEWLAPERMPYVVEQDQLEARGPLPARRRQMALVGRRGSGQPAVWGQQLSDDGVVRTALCAEPRDGRLHLFFPPLRTVEVWLELVAAVEEVAAEFGTPIVLEGYPPPRDYRLKQLQVTPDPGVIEVNVPPVTSWPEAVEQMSSLYEEARLSRLKAEKFLHDGRATGTGGGGHITLGGPSPADSPFLRRPALLGSLLGYWHNHPSLTYLFSSLFVGPTSQAPRVDEGRRDMRYELEIARQQLPHGGYAPPWLVDRVLRNIL
ncbi:MAG: transglutaminase family protein, partial [Candidatus Xenobia bacterium]